MSDNDDRKSSSSGRGPLPRRTRSRASRGRGRITPAGPSKEAAGTPVEASTTGPVNETAKAGGSREPPSQEAREAKSSAASKTDPGVGPAVKVNAPQTEGAPPTTADIASRPTQLDARNTPPASSEIEQELKRVTVVQVSDSPEFGEAPAGTAAYVGYVIDGRYRLESIIGRGGMGVVYRARHQIIDKPLAVKILLPTENNEVIARFVNEARAATAIGNAHIVDTVDFGQLPDGSTYFVMEYLDGETLSDRIKRDKYIAIPDALSIVEQVAEGMAAAHAANIIHRDLKPENMYIVEKEHEKSFVKLLDFGIAKIANAQDKLTRAGTIFGTPHYMSPEQAGGHEVDHRTDIYALGVTLYEMVAGRVPFEAENPMGLLTQHMYSPPPPLTKLEDPPQPISLALDAVVLKCLAKQPDDRYDSMADLRHDLERVARGALPAAISYLIARSEDPELVEAARNERARARGGSGWRVALLLAALAGGGGYFAVRAFEAGLQNETPFPEPSGSQIARVETMAAPSSSADPKNETRTVALVLSPIDAEVFQGAENLGSMPVSVAVPIGHRIQVDVKRDGFYPEKVDLDGSQRRVVVQLSAIPGAKPAVPVPDEAAIDKWKREHAAYVELESAKRSRDAASRSSLPDAGAPRTQPGTPLEGFVPRIRPLRRDAGARGPEWKPPSDGTDKKAAPMNSATVPVGSTRSPESPP